MTSSNGKFSALLALCEGNSMGPREFPAQRPVTRCFEIFLDLRLNKRLVNNREAGDLRRHRALYDVTVMMYQNTYSWFAFCHRTAVPMHRLICYKYVTVFMLNTPIKTYIYFKLFFQITAIVSNEFSYIKTGIVSFYSNIAVKWPPISLICQN